MYVLLTWCRKSSKLVSQLECTLKVIHGSSEVSPSALLRVGKQLRRAMCQPVPHASKQQVELWEQIQRWQLSIHHKHYGFGSVNVSCRREFAAISICCSFSMAFFIVHSILFIMMLPLNFLLSVCVCNGICCFILYLLVFVWNIHKFCLGHKCY